MSEPCPVCGSRQRHTTESDVVCAECGLVLEPIRVVDPPHQQDSQLAERRVMKLSPLHWTGTFVGAPNECTPTQWRWKQLQHHDNQDSRFRRLYHYLGKMCRLLELHNTHRKRAGQLFQLLYPKCQRGYWTKLAALCILIVARHANLPVSLPAITMAQEELHLQKLRPKDMLDMMEQMPVLEQLWQAPTPQQYLEGYLHYALQHLATKHDGAFTDQDRNSIRHQVQEIFHQVPQAHKDPRVFAATCIYAACQLAGWPVSSYVFQDEQGISSPSVRFCYREHFQSFIEAEEVDSRE